ncbi:MAG: hypothetical protein FWB83_03660 [Treponema sp.]|nr:hypothetical protein [Treponema sp.]
MNKAINGNNAARAAKTITVEIPVPSDSKTKFTARTMILISSYIKSPGFRNRIIFIY